MTARSRSSLDGMGVAVVARADDHHGELVDALLAGGARVVICADWSPFFDPPQDERLSAMVDPCVRHPGSASFITGFDGIPIGDVLWEPRRVVTFVSRLRGWLGRLDAIILGGETGLAEVVAAPLIRRLRRSGGEVIALVGDARSAAECVPSLADALSTELVPIVMCPGDGRRRRVPAALGPVARALIRSGELQLVTQRDVQRSAARRRREGDPLAGHVWSTAAVADHDHGGTVVVTSASLGARGLPPDLDLDWSVQRLSRLDELQLDGFIVSDHNGIAAIEVVNDGGRVVAVRVGTLSDSFDTDEPYQPVGRWTPGHAEILVGDPWAVLVDGEGTRMRLCDDSDWVIDLASLGGEMTGFRLWSDSARELAARPGST